MTLRDYLNVRRVFRTMAAEWGCPVWVVKKTIRCIIDRNWESALSDLETKALWDKYFPNGKPTPDEYVLWLGHAHEKGEEMPYLLIK